MPTRRYYANSAPQQTLASGITNAATSLTIQSSFAGWPASFPFFAVLEAGTANQEIISVTNIVGLTATVVRGQDSSTAVAHNAGATLDQEFVRQDADEANAHTSANSGVHGISGNVVGDTDVQTLSNKTLDGGTILSSTATGSGTVGGAIAVNTSGNITTTGNVSAAQVKATNNLLPPVYTNEAARDAAITSPVTGMECYLSAPTKMANPGKVWYDGTGWGPVPGAVVASSTGTTTVTSSGTTEVVGSGAGVSLSTVSVLATRQYRILISGLTSAVGGAILGTYRVRVATGSVTTSSTVTVSKTTATNGGSGAVAATYEAIWTPASSGTWNLAATAQSNSANNAVWGPDTGATCTIAIEAL